MTGHMTMGHRDTETQRTSTFVISSVARTLQRARSSMIVHLSPRRLKPARYFSVRVQVPAQAEPTRTANRT
jgi:hypothetical protein